MSEIRRFSIGAVIVSGLFFSGCETDREISFVKCDYYSGAQSTKPEDPVYLRENRVGTNYKITLGENKFLRNRKTGELEWTVNGVLQEMFSKEEIIVYDAETERTADITFTHHESYIKADIATECNSNKPLTPIKTY